RATPAADARNAERRSRIRRGRFLPDKWGGWAVKQVVKHGGCVSLFHGGMGSANPDAANTCASFIWGPMIQMKKNRHFHPAKGEMKLLIFFNLNQWPPYKRGPSISRFGICAAHPAVKQ